MGFFRIAKRKLINLDRRIYSKNMLKKAKSVGKHVVVCRKIQLLNPQNISIGNDCYFGPDCRIEAWTRYENQTFNPEIIIGNEVRINSTCHIGAINHIEIGDSCLLGSHVMIIDHSHGNNTKEELAIHPSDRELFSKGEIVIGDHCWLCENAVILPGVHIGAGTTIGANAVVTHDIPGNCVAAGNPAKVVKEIK